MGKAEKPVLTRPRMERYLEQPVAEASPDLEETRGNLTGDRRPEWPCPNFLAPLIDVLWTVVAIALANDRHL